MSQSKAFAQGTKPTQLNNPVPGADQDFANQKDVASLKPQKAPVQKAEPKMSALDELSHFSGEDGGSDKVPFPSQETAPQVKPSGSALDELGAISDSLDVGQKDQQTQVVLTPKTTKEMLSDLSRFEGKEIETSVLGLKVKQDKDGKILVKAPLGEKGYVEPNEAQRQVLSMYKNTLKDGMAMLHGGLTGAVAGSFGGPLVSAGLGLVGAAAGGFLGGQMSDQALGDYLSDDENAKKYYLLGKASGNESAPLTPTEAAVVEGAGNIFGSVIGLGLKYGGKVIASRSAAQQKTADLMAGDMANAMEAAKRTGVPLSGLEAAASIENSGAAGQLEKSILSGKEGETIRSEYANAVAEKKSKAIEFLEGVKKRFAPNADFDSPSGLEITKTVASGFNQGKNQKNIFSNVIDSWGSALNSYRQDALEKAGETRADVSPLIEQINGILKQAVPGFKGLNNASDFNLIKQQLKSKVGDQETKELLGHLAGFFDEIKVSPSAFEGEGLSKIPNVIVTDVFPQTESRVAGSSAHFQDALESQGSLPGFASSDHGPASMVSQGVQEGAMIPGISKPGFGPQGSVVSSMDGIQPSLPGQQTNIVKSANDVASTMGIGPNASGATSKGITLGYVNSFVDKLQDVAATTDNRYIQQLAGAARNFETDFIGKIYKDAGNEGVVREIGVVKDIFSKNIDDLYAMQNGLSKNLSDPGGWVVSLPSRSLRIMKEFLPKEQFDEFSGAAIRKAIVEDALANPSEKITSQSLSKKFLGDKAKRESMEVLLGKENVKDLESGLRVLRILENKNLTPAAIETQANILGKLYHTLGKTGDDIINFTLYGNPKASTAVKKSLDQYRSIYANREGVGQKMIKASKPIGNAVKGIIQASPLY